MAYLRESLLARSSWRGCDQGQETPSEHHVWLTISAYSAESIYAEKLSRLIYLITANEVLRKNNEGPPHCFRDAWLGSYWLLASRWQCLGEVYDGQLPRAVYVSPADEAVRGGGVQPAASASETLEDAWRIALENDDRIKAGGWDVSAASHTRAAASPKGALPSTSAQTAWCSATRFP